MNAARLENVVVPLGRILRAGEAGLYRDASAAMQTAKAEVEDLHARAAQLIAADRARCMTEAERDANAEAARMLAETSIAVRRCLAALPRELAEAIAEGVAKVIGGIDLAEAVARAAQRALLELSERHAVVVHVHPAAQPATRARLSAWESDVRVAGDADLAADSCVIETPAGFVRAGLSDQLAVLQSALRAAAAADA